MKKNDDELLKLTHQTIVENKRQKLVIWGSASDGMAQKCYTLDPSIPLLFSGKQALLLALKYYTGILPFCALKESALEIPFLHGHLESRVMKLVHSNTE